MDVDEFGALSAITLLGPLFAVVLSAVHSQTTVTPRELFSFKQAVLRRLVLSLDHVFFFLGVAYVVVIH